MLHVPEVTPEAAAGFARRRGEAVERPDAAAGVAAGTLTGNRRPCGHGSSGLLWGCMCCGASSDLRRKDDVVGHPVFAVEI